MSIIKSHSVGHGDMYHVRHNSDNFTIIDCMLPNDDDARATEIVDELVRENNKKGITRFISTHPDQDHVRGLEYLDSRITLRNFYCVKNAATKDEPTNDFKHYCKLRDDPDKAFYIFKGCSRKWMNQSDNQRNTAGIQIIWPNTKNPDYKAALKEAEDGGSPNNISAIIKYSVENGVKALWMGDLETDFMERIDGEFKLPDIDVLFAPHHGRESGRVPESWLDTMQPEIIVLGEADAKDIYYYPGWNTISQNRAGDIIFESIGSRVDVFVSSPTYTVGFLYDAGVSSPNYHYIGSFDV